MERLSLAPRRTPQHLSSIEVLEDRRMLSITALPVAAEVGALLAGEHTQPHSFAGAENSTITGQIASAETELSSLRERLSVLQAPAPVPHVASVEYGDQWILHLENLQPGWRIQLDVNVRGGTVDLVQTPVPDGETRLTLTADFHGRQGTRLIEVGGVDGEGNLQWVLNRVVEGNILPATRFLYTPPAQDTEEIEQARVQVTAAESALAALQAERAALDARAVDAVFRDEDFVAELSAAPQSAAPLRGAAAEASTMEAAAWHLSQEHEFHWLGRPDIDPQGNKYFKDKASIYWIMTPSGELYFEQMYSGGLRGKFTPDYYDRIEDLLFHAPQPSPNEPEPEEPNEPPQAIQATDAVLSAAPLRGAAAEASSTIDRLPGDPEVAALFTAPTIQIETEGNTLHVDAGNLSSGTYVFDFNERGGSVSVQYVTVAPGQTSVRVSAPYPRSMRDWHVLVGRVDEEKNLTDILSLIRNGVAERGPQPLSRAMHDLQTLRIPMATQQRVYDIKQEYGITALGETRDGRTVRIQEDGMLLMDGEPLVQLPLEYSFHPELFSKAKSPQSETVDLTPSPPPTEFPTLESEGPRELLRAFALQVTGMEKSNLDLRAIARKHNPRYFAEQPWQDRAMFDASAPQGENHTWATEGMIGMQREYLNDVQRGIHAWNTMVAGALLEAYYAELRQKLGMEPLREDFVGFNLSGGAHRDAARAGKYLGIPSADDVRAASSLYFPEIHRKHLELAGREVARYRNTEAKNGNGYAQPHPSAGAVHRSEAAIEQHLRVLREAHAADAAAYARAVDAYMGSIGRDARDVVAGNSDVYTRMGAVASGQTTEGLPLPLAPSPDGYPITLEQRGSVRLPFTLTEPMMVNVWTEGIGMRDVDLTIEGENLAQTYPSNKEGTTGESISLKLTPGTYTVTVKDATNYDGGTMATGEFPVTVHTEVHPYRTQEIIGRISIPESAETMPVRMRVAEFVQDENGQWRRSENYDGSDVTKPRVAVLDPSKPVWVVVHGMNNNEKETKMNNLTRELYAYAASHGFQIATVNWPEAAKDPLLIGRDAPWTEAVGRWAAQQLIGAGFKAHLINGIGHSHGTYAHWAMGTEIMRLTGGEQMNTLIALDPAGNIPPVSEFDHTRIDFAAVSRNSLAFEAAFVADSNRLAGTADVAFQIESPSTFRPSTEHYLGLTAFTEILSHERRAPGHFSEHFSLTKLMTPIDQQETLYDTNAYDRFFEGEIDVGVTEVQASDGTYYQATPSGLRFRRAGDSQEETVHFDT